MAVFFRASNRQLLKYITPDKSLMLIARPITLKVSEAPTPKLEGHDERNMRIGRPMSPHLTIYKPQLTSLLSISHRGTGMALGGYLTLLGFGAIALPNPIMHYLDAFQDIGWFSHFILKMFIAFPFCYHYVNGVRHLCWDMGQLLSIKQVYSSGYVMLALASISSVLLCL